MKAEWWGGSGLPGGIDAGNALVTAGHLVLISSIGGEIPIAAGFLLDLEKERLQPQWKRELPIEGRESLVDGGEGRVYLIAGDARLLVDAQSGELLSKADARIAPSAPAALVGAELIVPEGSELGAYDAVTLRERWRRIAPDDMRFYAVGDGACALNAQTLAGPEPIRVGLWHFASDRFVEVRAAPRITSAPLRVDSMLVLSCGGGSGDRQIGVRADDGSVVWRAPAPPPDPYLFKPPNISWGWGSPLNPIEPALFAYRDWVVAATQEPSIQARVAATGELVWRLLLTDEGEQRGSVLLTEGGTELSSVVNSQASALALIEDVVFAATHDRRLVAIDLEDGRLRDEVNSFDEVGHRAVSIAAISDGTAADGVLVVTALNDVYRITI